MIYHQRYFPRYGGLVHWAVFGLAHRHQLGRRAAGAAARLKAPCFLTPRCLQLGLLFVMLHRVVCSR